MPVSVLIVDDHRGLRESAGRILEVHGYTVPGEARNPVDASELGGLISEVRFSAVSLAAALAGEV